MTASEPAPLQPEFCMSTYTCPTCGETMQRDMELLYRHTEKHIVDEIKKKNPQWVTENGYCEKCVNYYKNEMGKSGAPCAGELPEKNIGTKGALYRLLMGVVMFAAAIWLFYILQSGEHPRVLRFLIFFPFFISMLGFIQSKRQVCVFYGLKGVEETGKGCALIQNTAGRSKLKDTAFYIIKVSALAAAGLTAGLYFL